MRKKVPMSSVVLFLSLASSARAGEVTDCSHDTSTLLRCISIRSTVAQRNENAGHEAKEKIAAAKEFVNPVLTVQGLKASPHDLSGDSVQAALLFSYDLHGLRKSRAKAAQAGAEAEASQIAMENLDFYRTSLTALHKIRLLRKELSIQFEIEKSIDQMLTSFKRRPRLTPEQEGTRTLLQFSRAEMHSRIALQEQEKHALEHDIEIQIGQTWIPSEANLPNAPQKWPELSMESTVPAESLPARHARSVDLQMREESEVSRIEKRPFILVGPSAEWTQIEGERGVRAGATIQVPLDIIESHSGSRELKNVRAERSSAAAAANLREIAGEFDHNRETYRQSVATLSAMEDREVIRQRLKRVEGLLRRGLVSASIYIETLRQFLGSTQARDELEVKAIDAFCRDLILVKSSAEGCMR